MFNLPSHPQVPSFTPQPALATGVRQLFTAQEDEHLKTLVKRYGDKSWKKISQEMTNRTPRQCRERYKNYLSPTINKGPWTAEEDALLTEMYRHLGPKWAAIATFFDSRSDVNIKNRWTSICGREKMINATARIEMPQAAEPPPHEEEKEKEQLQPKPKPKLPPISSLDVCSTRPVPESREDPQEIREELHGLTKTFPNYGGNIW